MQIEEGKESSKVKDKEEKKLQQGQEHQLAGT